MLLSPLTNFCLLAVAVKAWGLHNDPGLTIDTSSGRVTGFVNSTAPNVRQWLGVPYAEPPIGDLRFLPPVPKKAVGSLQTTSYQPSCMQQLSNTPTVYTERIPEFLINGGNSEDCLYINIYAPLHPTTLSLPVFVYIPGGGFTGGGADSLYKIPDQWIERTQSHLFVIMNYRLNVFGYPNARSAPQNAGLLDQRAVVEWVSANIAAFGGDPDRITLWGQSAGGASVGMYGYAYPQDPLVTGLIADSGAATILTATDPMHSAFSAFAGHFDCGNLSSGAELSCMQRVDAEEIQHVLSFGNTNITFTPVADGITAFSNVTERLSQGDFANIPYLTGSNANEGAGFGTFNKSGLSPGQYETGLRAITCPVAHEVANHEKFGYTMYRYLYAGNFSNISPLPWIGATHSAELPLVFGTHYEYRENSTEFEWRVASSMQEFWLSFANNPLQNPTDGEIVWPNYKHERETMMLLASSETVHELVLGEEVDKECAL